MGSSNPIVAEIKKESPTIFRRLYFKRKYQAGYESNWQLIEESKVKKWGSHSYNIDDVKLNFFNISSQEIQLKNDDSYFADENNVKSFFNDTVTRYGTLCKIECGYEDSVGNEYPSNPSIFIGYLRDDIKTGSDGIIKMRFRHVNSFLDEERAEKLILDGSQTASDLIGQIRDYTNGSGDAFFSDVIQGWNILETSNIYTNLDTAAVEGISFWELIKKLAAAENAITFVDRTGVFYFANRDFNRVDNEPFHFSGVGDNDKSHGHNIIKLINFDMPVSRIYNYIRIKYLEEDTTTSYVTEREGWQWGDSSSSYRYGVRKYEDEIDWIQDTSTAETIAKDLFNEHRDLKREVSIEAKYIPHVEPFNKVSLTYITPRLEGENLWGKFLWGKKNWNAATGRYININDQNFKIQTVKHDIDNIKSAFTMRETNAYVPGYNSSFYGRLYYNE